MRDFGGKRSPLPVVHAVHTPDQYPPIFFCAASEQEFKPSFVKSGNKDKRKALTKPED